MESNLQLNLNITWKNLQVENVSFNLRHQMMNNYGYLEITSLELITRFMIWKIKELVLEMLILSEMEIMEFKLEQFTAFKFSLLYVCHS